MSPRSKKEYLGAVYLRYKRTSRKQRVKIHSRVPNTKQAAAEFQLRKD